MPTLDATVGGSAANSYETYAEADVFLGNRIPLNPPWIASGGEAYLITATRLMDNLSQPFKTFFPSLQGAAPYYRVRRQWTGMPATPTQKLAWPRIGMFDANNNPLDFAFMVAVGTPSSIVTTTQPHNQVTGNTVLILTSTSTPSIVGPQLVTVLTPYTFSIPVAVTVAGTGTMTYIPQDLKDAESEFAGQLLQGDRSLDNAVIVQGLTAVKAGSVSLSFKQEIMPQVVPDAVFNIMPQSWLTDELYVLANPALFEVISKGSRHDDQESERW